MYRPRITVAGTETGVGKTTVVLGLMSALKQRGIQVQGFKVGPDPIDPGHHQAVTGRPSRNLDLWMMSSEVMEEVFLRGSEGVDVSVVEGAMGLFDGKAPDSDEGSTAEVALRLNSPVLLVLNASGMARSAAAVVRGFRDFHPGVRLAGVIANRVGGEGHFQLIRTAVEKECGIPVLGWLPDKRGLTLPEGRQGLVTPREPKTAFYEALGKQVGHSVDLEAILKLSRAAPPLEKPRLPMFREGDWKGERPVIAVASDAAFHFCYPENIELLQLWGAEVVRFSPLAGESVPREVAGLWIGGGLTEEFAAPLAAGEEVKRSIREAVAAGMPVYGEGGGYIYLSRALIDSDGNRHRMTGVIPEEVRMHRRLVAMGYREVTALGDTPLLKRGEKARGYQFRYSTRIPAEDSSWAYTVEGGWEGPEREGFAKGEVLAGFTHLHFASHPAMVERWMEQCCLFRRRNCSEL